MKTIYKMVLLTVVSLITFTGCNNDEYLVDGGKANPYYDGNIWEYLNNHPYHEDLFGDLTQIISLAGLEDICKNENITLFAPTNESIRRSLNSLNQVLWASGYERLATDENGNYYLDQVKPEVWRDMLSLYIFKDKYRLKDIAQVDTLAMTTYPGQITVTRENNYHIRLGVVYDDAGGIKYAGARKIVFRPENVAYPLWAHVATCDIQPTNGVVHVISLTQHAFGFEPSYFVIKAVQAGIDYHEKSTIKGVNSKNVSHENNE